MRRGPAQGTRVRVKSFYPRNRRAVMLWTIVVILLILWLTGNLNF